MANSPVVGISRLGYAPVLTDNENGITFGTVYNFNKKHMNISAAPTTNSGQLWAEDQSVDTYTNKNGGSVTVGITHLTSEEKALLYGEKIDTVTSVLSSHKDDVVPDGILIFATKSADGSFNLYKLPKTKFNGAPVASASKTESGQTYSTVSLTGMYANTIFDGYDKYELEGVTSQTVIDAWFASATGGLPT